MKFSVPGLDTLLEKLGKVQAKFQDKNVWQEIAQIELQDIRNRIGVSKTTPEGVPWAPWKPSTALARAKKGNANRGLLFDSGRLLNSFKVIANKTAFTVGTDVPYAGFLNKGTDKMPGRKFMGTSPQAKASIKAILDKHIGLPKQ